MYEPIRTKSVHTPADHADDFPHRTREEELDIQLAGHLAALLAVTDELGLGEAGDRIAEQVARLRGAPPARHMRPERRARDRPAPPRPHPRGPGPGGGGVPRGHRGRDPLGRAYGRPHRRCRRRIPRRPVAAGRRPLTAPVHVP